MIQVLRYLIHCKTGRRGGRNKIIGLHILIRPNVPARTLGTGYTENI